LKKKQLDGNFFLSWHQYEVMLLDYWSVHRNS